MSTFYTEIAKYYDLIFPVGSAQVNLITELAGDVPKDILDVACGSGGYSKKLSDMGYHVTAIDLDQTMVRKLKEKTGTLDARVLNMLQIDEMNKTYDLIFCIGNSIAHLNDSDEIFTFLEKSKKVLKLGGHFVIQIVNYDRILASNIKSLPSIKNAEANLVFERYYNYLPGENKIDFKTILKVAALSLENNVLLHPIKSTELAKLLEAAGFTNIKTYGNFNKGEYDPMDSFSLVIVAQC